MWLVSRAGYRAGALSWSTFSQHLSLLVAGACFWVDTLQWCQGTNDGPHGEEWAYRGALRVHCVTSNDDAGGKRIGCAAGTLVSSLSTPPVPCLIALFQASCLTLESSQMLNIYSYYMYLEIPSNRRGSLHRSPITQQKSTGIERFYCIQHCLRGARTEVPPEASHARCTSRSTSGSRNLIIISKRDPEKSLNVRNFSIYAGSTAKHPEPAAAPYPRMSLFSGVLTPSTCTTSAVTLPSVHCVAQFVPVHDGHGARMEPAWEA